MRGQKLHMHWTELTDQQARDWLMENDPEGRDLWMTAAGDDLRDAVCDNLGDFDEKPQSGKVTVTLERV